MTLSGQEKSTGAAVAPIPDPGPVQALSAHGDGGPNAEVAPVPGPEPARAWDRRIWLVPIALALIVSYGFLCIRALSLEAKYRSLAHSLAGNAAYKWRPSFETFAHPAAVHGTLGNILYAHGKYEEAVAYFTEALRLDPDLAGVHNNLGNALYAQGKYEEAVGHLAQALRLNPNSADAHYNLGVALQGKGRYQAAEGHYVEAVRLRPGYADAHKNLGNVLNAKGEHAEAATHFTEALRLNPGYADVHNSLGTILSRQRKYPEAEAHFNEALRLHPGNVQAHHNLGLVLSRLGNYEAASAQFAEAIRLDSGFADAYNASAMLMAACPEAKFRDGKKAVEFATRACELTKSKNPIILDTLAAAQAEAGDFDAAVRTQKRALELLNDERQKDDYRSRLVLYQAKKPYREGPPQHALTEARP